MDSSISLTALLEATISRDHAMEPEVLAVPAVLANEVIGIATATASSRDAPESAPEIPNLSELAVSAKTGQGEEEISVKTCPPASLASEIEESQVESHKADCGSVARPPTVSEPSA